MTGVNRELAEEMNTRIIPASFSQTVEGVTHRNVHGSEDMAIDWCWYNCPSRHVETINVSDGASHHNLIKIRFRNQEVMMKRTPTVHRVFAQYSKEEFCSRLAEED